MVRSAQEISPVGAGSRLRASTLSSLQASLRPNLDSINQGLLGSSSASKKEQLRSLRAFGDSSAREQMMSLDKGFGSLNGSGLVEGSRPLNDSGPSEQDISSSLSSSPSKREQLRSLKAFGDSSAKEQLRSLDKGLPGSLNESGPSDQDAVSSALSSSPSKREQIRSLRDFGASSAKEQLRSLDKGLPGSLNGSETLEESRPLKEEEGSSIKAGSSVQQNAAKKVCREIRMNREGDVEMEDVDGDVDGDTAAGAEEEQVAVWIDGRRVSGSAASPGMMGNEQTASRKRRLRRSLDLKTLCGEEEGKMTARMGEKQEEADSLMGEDASFLKLN